jgi:hypothetical protein
VTSGNVNENGMLNYVTAATVNIFISAFINPLKLVSDVMVSVVLVRSTRVYKSLTEGRILLTCMWNAHCSEFDGAEVRSLLISHRISSQVLG